LLYILVKEIFAIVGLKISCLGLVVLPVALLDSLEHQEIRTFEKGWDTREKVESYAS
jgi:hypothetical protein